MFPVLMYLAITPAASYWIERSHRGDIFSAQSTHCSYYNSQCTAGYTGWLWNDCTECQCYDGSTIYQDYCHRDVSRDFLGCEIFIKGTQHYGMATHTFESSTKEIGFIMRKSSWEQRLYKECTLHEESQYWDTAEWTNLFTDGREISDFYLHSTDNGVLLKFLGTYDNYYRYHGLLLNLKLSCRTYYESSVSSCLTIKVEGKRDYSNIPKPKPEVTTARKTYTTTTSSITTTTTTTASATTTPITATTISTTTTPATTSPGSTTTVSTTTTTSSPEPASSNIPTSTTTTRTTITPTMITKEVIASTEESVHDNILDDRTTESVTEKETTSTDTVTQTRRVTTESSILSSLSSLESSPNCPIDKKTTTAEMNPVTSAFQQTPSTRKDDNVTKNIIPIFGAAIFLLFFCVILIVCHLKRRTVVGTTARTGLLKGRSQVTYNSSGEYVTSSEFEKVHKSTFSDVKELKMQPINSFRVSNQQGPSGILYINRLTDSFNSSTTVASEESENPLITERVLKKIEDDRRFRWLQKGV